MGTMRTAGLALATMAAIGAAGARAQDARCPDGDEKVVRIEITVDREAGALRFVTPLDFDGVVDQKSRGLSRDGRTVVVQSDVSESNLWLLSFPELSEDSL